MMSLQEAIDNFEKRAQNYGTISGEGVDIQFLDGYAVLRAEVDDGDDTIVCKQSLEFWEEDVAPVKPLNFTAE
jgi:hypothetical protein